MANAKKTFTKAEAADYLGVSERAIERYTAKGLLSVAYDHVRSERDGRQRQRAFYAKADLDDLQNKMSESTALTTRHGDSRLVATSNAAANPAAFAAALASAISANQSVLPNHKLTLNLKEASQLAGLSKAFLREAIAEGKLKAAIRGKGWNIKRDDLDFFIKRL